MMEMKLKDEEIFEVECINAENRKELVKGEIYLVKQSKYYTNYYELEGHTYKKERFKPVDKLEGKSVKKVRCINKEKFQEITIGKEYKVKSESEKLYYIENDLEEETGYLKHRFEEVEPQKEEIKRNVYKGIKCIVSDSVNITKNKEYETYQESEKFYWIKENDWGSSSFYKKEWFEEVEEKKEYSVMELFQEEEGIEYKIKGIDNLYKVENGILRRSVDKGFYETMYCDKEILKAKFTKVEEPKPVNTIEAFKELEEGKTIMSVISNNQYKKYGKDKFRA